MNEHLLIAVSAGGPHPACRAGHAGIAIGQTPSGSECARDVGRKNSGALSRIPEHDV